MDCDKFEDIMLDELYGELDELTSAAAKRHVAGCARCSALLGGLRATRRVATLPVVAPSPGFEERLLAAVAEAETRSKPKLGLARVISLGGRWAMRPQTAMAAVFLLIIGMSSVLVSRRAPKSAASSAQSFTVTENGAPAAAAPTAVAKDESPPLDPQAAAAAHGPAAPLARAAPSPMSLKPASQAGGLPSGADGLSSAFGSGVASNDDHAAKKEAYAVPHSSKSLGGYGGGGSLANSQSADISPPAPAASFAPPPPPRERDTEEAASPLTAARAARDTGGGCAVAAGEFDAVAAASWGTAVGYDATLEGAQCYARMGQGDAARSRFNRLLTVPAYASRAQTGINATSVVAAKARAVSKSAPAAPPAAGAAQAAPATPAASPTANDGRK
jgi:hypothetical protein